MSDNAEILVYLMMHDEALERLLGADWPRIRDALVELVARIDAEVSSPALSRDVDAFIGALMKGPARGIAVTAVAQSDSAAMSVPRFERAAGQLTAEVGTAGLPRGPTRSVLMPVFFATNRVGKSGGALGSTYTADRAEDLGFGVANVNVPLDREIGTLPTPRLWKFDLHPDPARHFLVIDLHSFSREQWVETIGGALLGASHASEPGVLLFIHGYNVTFESAALQAAQISRDLKFQGATALFSWASKGHPLGYVADGATIDASAPHLEGFLRLIVERIGASTLDVIAHSMGNRALCAVLERFQPKPQDSCRIRQVIFAAPDVDAQRFKQLAQAFHSRARRCTLYSSRNDWALRLSRLLAAYGRAGGEVLLASGVDTVDASSADTSLCGLGHSYFATVRSILGDIAELIATNANPDQRFNLERVPNTAPPYWRYRN